MNRSKIAVIYYFVCTEILFLIFLFLYYFKFNVSLKNVEKDTMNVKNDNRGKQFDWRKELHLIIAFLESISFGLMLGWPSSIFPKLLSDDSVIPVTLDQTAPIAGFLIFGVILATLISRWRISKITYKIRIILSTILSLIGWLIMLFAWNIYCIFISRLFVGFGHGYAVGHLNDFVALNKFKKNLKLIITCLVFLGMLVAYSVGPCVNFYKFSLVSTSITLLVLFSIFFLPNSVDGESRSCVNDEVVEMSFFKICKSAKYSKKVFSHFSLTFFQQYTGVPPLIVYTEILFETLNYCRPSWFALAFVVFYASVTIFFTVKSKKLDSKTFLLYSSILQASALWLIVAIINWNVEKNFPYSTLFAILFMVYVHGVGLNWVPGKIVNTYFPPEARGTMEIFYTTCHYFFAITSTKIFQVIYGIYGLKICFLFNAIIGSFSFIFVAFFVPDQLDIY